MATYFVITYTATAGENGPLLGSDEEDIVIMQFLIWDAVNRKVRYACSRAACGAAGEQGGAEPATNGMCGVGRQAGVAARRCSSQ